MNNSFFLTPTTPSEIFDIINSLNNKKATGPNSLPVYILKVYNPLFSDLLSKIINLSFVTGIFPELCKLAKVIPIFKKDNEQLCENYRPISLLPIFSKIYEKIIYIRMYKFLIDNNLLYNRQFGFRSQFSTTHALISLTERIKSLLDMGHVAAGIFLDLKKAFDTVNHHILITKLYYYGFRGISNILLKSFLLNRKQFVSINGFNSEILNVTCGIPQGSTLGPLLFLIYINDFRFSLEKSYVSHFADDTCLTQSANDKNSLELSLNSELINVAEWLYANRLSLNVNKSKLLLFQSKWLHTDQNDFVIKLAGHNMKLDKFVNFLGVTIDNNLSWDCHILNLSKKLGRANGIISILRHFVPKKTMLSVYHAIFQSQIMYGCPVWSMTSLKNVNTINLLQKKCIRILNFGPFNCHTNSLFHDNKLLKLNDIVKNEVIKLAYQFKNNALPNDLNCIFQCNENIYNTRNMNHGGLIVPIIKTKSYGDRTLRYTVPRVWNDFIKNVNINIFNNINQLKRFLKINTIETYNAYL